MLNDSIKLVLHDLREFEKSVALRDRQRTRLVEMIRSYPGDAEAVSDLREMVAWRRELHDLLEALELALKNSAATFARFDKKAEKDAALIAEAMKKGGKSFTDDDPILVAQRQAFKRTAQKLDFAMDELFKLRDTLSFKFATRSSPELSQLHKALGRDLGEAQEGLGDGQLNFCKVLVKRFEQWSEQHHLDRS